MSNVTSDGHDSSRETRSDIRYYTYQYQTHVDTQLAETTKGDRRMDKLQIVVVSSTQCFVQMYGWNHGAPLFIDKTIDVWGNVNVPVDHVAFVSLTKKMRHIGGCRQNSGFGLRIYMGGKEHLRYYSLHKYLPAVANTATVRVRACCHPAGIETLVPCDFSFLRLQVTFHEVNTSFPHRLPNGQWNCSFPEWVDFRSHFDCNLEPECASSEDEADCPHSGCGPGNISVSGSCFFFVQLEARRVSWGGGRDACIKRGGHLASLKTVSKWNTVTKALKTMKNEVKVIVGLASAPSMPSSIYGQPTMWTDNTVAYYVQYETNIRSPTYICGVFDEHTKLELNYNCERPMIYMSLTLCEATYLKQKDISHDKIYFQYPEHRRISFPHVTCHDGQSVLSFVPCESLSESDYANEKTVSGLSPSSAYAGSSGPYYLCRTNDQYVPFSLLCDHRQDCVDNSDEDSCRFAPCRGSTPLRCGTSHQCISLDQWCDGQNDCYQDQDDRDCLLYGKAFSGKVSALPPPAVVNFDPKASYTGISMTKLSPGSNGSYICPESHFQCSDDGYCLPVFLRCNGVNDCPSHEDEKDCDTYTCPGFYRCRASTICVHAQHVCDSLYHCPRQDDELYCHIHCPTSCTCHGLAFKCPKIFAVQQFPDLRYLDSSDSGFSLTHLSANVMLVYLSLARCSLSVLSNTTLPNLQILDLSDNCLVSISTDDLSLFVNLRELILSGNPLISLLRTTHTNTSTFPLLVRLDSSRVVMKRFNLNTFRVTPNLETLNLSNNKIERLEGTFEFLEQLMVVDLDGCQVKEFSRNLFQRLRSLERVHAHNFKLCCSAMLPETFNPKNCFAPFNEVSSCESLLRSDFYRILLSVFAILSLLGNLGSIGARMFVSKQSRKSGFASFVSHLCVSDFVMGVYLAIIGVADRQYKGVYLWEDTDWRHSVGCKMAGFLSLVSSEVSAIVVCFITLDRFLALRFPFSALHFTAQSAHATCAATWLFGLAVATVPLLPATSHWDFYSQTGICIPLPITRNDFPGRDFAFGVMIIVNFLLFVMIAMGQIFIYISIRANSMNVGSDSSRKDQDVSIARRLITIAVSDFLCWFPIGLLGLLATSGFPVPGEVNVAMAIMVLPLNSALNPFLYNLNLLLERLRAARERRLLHALETVYVSV